MVEPCRPFLVYPARGLATLWETGKQPSGGALAALLGRTRAQLHTILAAPGSTTSLARRLGITPAAVRQHLIVLKNSGLVTGTRDGRAVLYRRTTRGDTLLDN